MSYIVDTLKPPITLLRELFNYANNTTYTEGELHISDGPVSGTYGNYNSRITLAVDEPGPQVDVPTATVYYNRIDLSTLFSEVGCHLNHTDDVVTGDPDLGRVRAELARRYAVAEDHNLLITKIANDWHVVAESGHPAMVGGIPFTNARRMSNLWQLETDAIDSIDTADFIVSGAVPAVIDGRSCFRVGGSKYLESPWLEHSGAWSYSMHYYPINFIGYTHLFSAYPTQAVFALKITSTGVSEARPYFHSSSTGSQYGSSTINTNAWHHLVFTYDGNGRLRVYINGTLAHELNGTAFSTAGSIYRVGQGYKDEHAEGYIAGIRRYNVELTADEVTLLKNNA